MSGTAAGLATMIRSVLTNPHSEQSVRQQLIGLASRNLHEEDVVTALVEILPQVQEGSTRRTLLDMLLRVESSRLQQPDAFCSTLMTLYREERERGVRVRILERLSLDLHRHAALAVFFVSTLLQADLSDAEQAVVMATLGSLPHIPEDVAILALQQGRRSPASSQMAVLGILERCPTWTDAMVSEALPYLDPSVSVDVRLRLYERLRQARRLGPELVPAIEAMATHDPDVQARLMAVRWLHEHKQFDSLFWIGKDDADVHVRSEAIRLQAQHPSPNLKGLTAQLGTEVRPEVRRALLDLLKTHLRDPEVRTALARLACQTSSLETAERTALWDVLAPYLARDEALVGSLFALAETLPQEEQRHFVVVSLLPRVAEPEPWVARWLTRERNPQVKVQLIGHLKSDSCAHHAELVAPLCAELGDPGSGVRRRCAELLGPVAGGHAAVPPVLEDVLLHDRDPLLLQPCLEAYLRDGVPRQFEVLAVAVRNDRLDRRTRLAAVDAIARLDLSEEQRTTLASLRTEV